ncbi:hypothetical protein GIB67_003312 [Kingdonia uniflora]|uniref:Superoxide dismutase copper/zinc binding domain-containing protein n=1 Tax=Kingdonia uniflora TaxID=39325 RepID=A0A7J7P9K4_9MAGN|nr:hypothetical protein GIB67_003312 [Kingdonia uniflora]
MFPLFYLWEIENGESPCEVYLPLTTHYYGRSHSVINVDRLSLALVSTNFDDDFECSSVQLILEGFIEFDVALLGFEALSRLRGPTTVNVKITGLDLGPHGIHLYEFEDTTNGCISAGWIYFGPYFNPNGLTHGAPEDEVHHSGDLGNIIANADAVAEATIVDTLEGMNLALTLVMMVEDWHAVR